MTKSELIAKDKCVVVPGEVLVEGMDYLPGFGTYRLGERILASRLGLVNIDGRAIKIIPLSGRYLPKRNDVIIGRVIDVTLNGWRLDINSAYTAMLMIKDGTSDFVNKGADLTQYYNLGDYIVCKIINVTTQKLVDVTMRGPGLKKLKNGRILKVNPFKVPRIIGKQGSMVSMIKDATKCWIIVGQNGIIWLQGKPRDEVIAVQAIRMIEKEAHLPGLTDKIKQHLESFYGKQEQKETQKEIRSEQLKYEIGEEDDL
ncbi:MAG: exosome complex RNA-binding protein Rrp4 [Candidatus Woesearchaeota archaeon]